MSPNVACYFTLSNARLFYVSAVAMLTMTFQDSPFLALNYFNSKETTVTPFLVKLNLKIRHIILIGKHTLSVFFYVFAFFFYQTILEKTDYRKQILVVY